MPCMSICLLFIRPNSLKNSIARVDRLRPAASRLVESCLEANPAQCPAPCPRISHISATVDQSKSAQHVLRWLDFCRACIAGSCSHRQRGPAWASRACRHGCAAATRRPLSLCPRGWPSTTFTSICRPPCIKSYAGVRRGGLHVLCRHGRRRRRRQWCLSSASLTHEKP